MNDAVMQKAKAIALKTTSWRDAKKRIKNENIELSASQMLDVLDFWQKNIASHFTDGELISELIFWAEGGTFDSHLSGYDAINPKILAYEAKKRNWSVVFATTGGFFIVNPPNRSPLVIKNTF